MTPIFNQLAWASVLVWHNMAFPKRSRSLSDGGRGEVGGDAAQCGSKQKNMIALKKLFLAVFLGGRYLYWFFPVIIANS
jgi:hypothetical protein